MVHIDVIIVDYLTDAGSAASNADGANFRRSRSQSCQDMPQSGRLGPLSRQQFRSVQGVHAVIRPSQGELYLERPLIYVDNDSAMAGGS